jgi:hypothetical protein
LPFSIRAKGIAILYACKALVSVFNQYGKQHEHFPLFLPRGTHKLIILESSEPHWP